MSAKFFKKDSAFAVTAFSIPSIGGAENHYAEDHYLAAENIPAGNTDVEETFSLNSFAEPAIEEAYPTSDQVLQNAQSEAAQIIAQAERDREMIEAAALEKAQQEMQSAIETEISERTRELKENFAETMRRVDGLRDEISARVEQEVVELAMEIAKKIVRREVVFDHDIALTLVKVSLKKIHSRTLAQVHVNPEDFAFIEAHRETIDFRGSLEFIEDRSISQGGCLIHTETGDVDATIESQFAEIAHGLLGK